MRVESLSDHARQQMGTAEQQLRAQASRLKQLEGERQEARRAVRAARRGKSMWKRLLRVPTLEESDARGRAADLQLQGHDARRDVILAGHTVEQHAAGVAGEDALVAGLRRLSDDWTLLRGYQNKRGEADGVLVGPGGVWAIEVKRRPVRVHVIGDTWRLEKLDRWGNIVDTSYGTDNRGRSWARQVNDVAGDLAAWLGKNRSAVPIRTAVLVMHERAQIGSIKNPTVDLVAVGVQDLLKDIRAGRHPLGPKERQEILGLIRRDHRFHDRRRRGDSGGTDPGRGRPHRHR